MRKIFLLICLLGGLSLSAQQLDIIASSSDITRLRTMQQVGLLKDYISLIMREDVFDEDITNYYSEQALQLFCQEAKVIVKYNEKETIFAPIEFFKILPLDKERIVDLDSIEVIDFYFSHWDSVSDSSAVSKTWTMPLNKMSLLDDIEYNDNKILVHRERTPNGYEWIAPLGNLYVSVSKDFILDKGIQDSSEAIIQTDKSLKQTITPALHNMSFNKLLDRELYFSKVKLIDEFIKRFNGEEIYPNANSLKETDRINNIIALFDFHSLKKDANILSYGEDFVTAIVRDSIQLHYSDTDWYAKIICNGFLGKKEVQFALYLKVESRGEDMYKWVLIGAEGEIFDLKPTEVKKVLPKRGEIDESSFILPNAHEVSFMSLAGITKNNAKNIMSFVEKDFRTNQLSVFLTLVNKGMLTISTTQDAEFVFCQVPNYLFKVKKFVREEKNSGWLIYSLEKISEE